MEITVSDLIAALTEWAPLKLAEDWDNVGLQVGSLRKRVSRVAVALDLTPSTLSQAIEHEIDCLVTHHPFFFKPLKRIDYDHWSGKLIQGLIKEDIALISLHTNLDSARQGVTEVLAEALNLRLRGAIRPCPGAKWYKLVTYVPKGDEEKIRALVLSSEAGVIGAYRGCTFASEGTGTFFPDAEANPAVGEQGKLNFVAETRFEFVIPSFARESFLKRLRKIHPYEEVPVDLYPLEAFDPRYGLGRLGELPLDYTVQDLALKLKKVLGTEAVFTVGDPTKIVRKVALCAGAGADLFLEAKAKGAEVYITAEIKYHQAREAEALNFPLIVTGHFESEHLIVPKMAEFLENWAKNQGVSLEIKILEEKTPFNLVKG